MAGDRGKGRDAVRALCRRRLHRQHRDLERVARFRTVQDAVQDLLEHASEPTFSPDRTRFAFKDWSDGGALYVANPDGGGRVKISSIEGDAPGRGHRTAPGSRSPSTTPRTSAGRSTSSPPTVRTPRTRSASSTARTSSSAPSPGSTSESAGLTSRALRGTRWLSRKEATSPDAPVNRRIVAAAGRAARLVLGPSPMGAVGRINWPSAAMLVIVTAASTFALGCGGDDGRRRRGGARRRAPVDEQRLIAPDAGGDHVFRDVDDRQRERSLERNRDLGRRGDGLPRLSRDPVAVRRRRQHLHRPRRVLRRPRGLRRAAGSTITQRALRPACTWCRHRWTHLSAGLHLRHLVLGDRQRRRGAWPTRAMGRCRAVVRPRSATRSSAIAVKPTRRRPCTATSALIELTPDSDLENQAPEAALGQRRATQLQATAGVAGSEVATHPLPLQRAQTTGAIGCARGGATEPPAGALRHAPPSPHEGLDRDPAVRAARPADGHAVVREDVRTISRPTASLAPAALIHSP